MGDRADDPDDVMETSLTIDYDNSDYGQRERLPEGDDNASWDCFIQSRDALSSSLFPGLHQGSVVRRPDSAIHWISIFFNLRKIGR